VPGIDANATLITQELCPEYSDLGGRRQTGRLVVLATRAG